MKELINMLLMSQETLYDYCLGKMKPYGRNIISTKDYIISYPDTVKAPMITAHLDKVDKVPTINNIAVSIDGNIRSIPYEGKSMPIGGDDRCGVYILLEAYKELNNTCIFALFKDEEKGCLGSKEYVKSDNIKKDMITYIIGLDRRGENSYVTYDKDNEDLINIVESCGLKKERGSVSDCRIVAESTKKACINLSVGFYGEHTDNEYIIVKTFPTIVANIKKIVEKTGTTEYEYKEPERKIYNYYPGTDLYGSGFYGNVLITKEDILFILAKELGFTLNKMEEIFNEEKKKEIKVWEYIKLFTQENYWSKSSLGSGLYSDIGEKISKSQCNYDDCVRLKYIHSVHIKNVEKNKKETLKEVYEMMKDIYTLDSGKELNKEQETIVMGLSRIALEKHWVQEDCILCAFANYEKYDFYADIEQCVICTIENNGGICDRDKKDRTKQKVNARGHNNNDSRTTKDRKDNMRSKLERKGTHY